MSQRTCQNKSILVILETHYPTSPLDDLIKEFYLIRIETGKNVRSIPVIDDCCYDLVFFKEQKGALFYGKNDTLLPMNSGIFTIHGLSPPYKIQFEDTLTFFTIKFQPWANRYFFPDLKGKGVLDLGVSDPSMWQLHKALFGQDEPEKCFALAEQYMLPHLSKWNPSMELVREVCTFVYDKSGKVTVNELSEQFQRSRQYLGKVFKKEVMYSLKKFIITVRILDLVKYKAKHPNISLTQICYDYGYFDQSHFINDFKKVCGVKPLQFFNNLPEFMLRHQ